MTNHNEEQEVARKQGRPELPLVEKEKTVATKLAVSLNTLEAEFDSMLCLSADERNEPRGMAVIANAELRLSIANDIELLNDDIRSAIESEDKALESKKKSKKATLMAELDRMAPLGYTQPEWDAVGDEFKVKELGRPKLSIEFKLNRARTDFKSKLSTLNRLEAAEEMEKSTFESLLLEHQSKLKKVKGKKVLPGRPKYTQVDILKRDLKKVNDKINYIVSGEAHADQQRRLAESNAGSDGKRVGRPLTDLNKKLSELIEQQTEIKAKINELGGWGETGSPVAIATITSKVADVAVVSTSAPEASTPVSAVAVEENTTVAEEDPVARIKRIREESRLRRQQALLSERSAREEEMKTIASSIAETDSKNTSERDEESEFNELVSFFGLDEDDIQASKMAS